MAGPVIIEGPDGQEFEFPEGTGDDVISITIRRAYADQPAATPSPPVPPQQAPAYREVRKLPGNARLLEGPNGAQVLVAGNFATSDPKQIKNMLAPLEAAEKSRAEAKAIRQQLLDNQKRYGTPPKQTRGTVVRSNREVEAAQKEARALRQEAAFEGLMRRNVEQSMGADFAAKNPIAAGALQFLKGLPFVGGAVDEALGAVTQTPAMTQMGVSGTDIVRGAQAETERVAPAVSTGLQIAGGVTGAVATPGLLGAVTARGATPGAQLASGVTRGGVVGAAEGAATGAGLAEEGQRLQGAVTGGLTGAAIGTLGGGVPPGGQQVMVNLRNTIGRVDDTRLAKELGVSREVATLFRQAVDGDDFQAAADALQRAGGASMLADASPALRDFLDLALQVGGPGAKREARGAIEERVRTGAIGFQQYMDRVLGVPEGIEAAGDAIRLASAPERKSLYDAAYAKPIDYSAPSGRQVEELLDRIKVFDPSAFATANKLLAADGLQSQQILFDVATDGTITFRRMPDVRQIDYIRGALNDIAYGNPSGSMGGKSRLQTSAAKLSRDLRDAVGETVPEYKEALKKAASTIEELNALDVGQKAFGGRMTRSEVRAELGTMTDPERTAAAIGFRQAIDDKLARIGQLASDPNRDARELSQMVKDMTSKDFEQKLEIIVGPAKAKDFITELNKEIAAINLRAGVATNSKTMPREELMKLIRQQAEPGPIKMLLKNPKEGVKNLLQGTTGLTEEAIAARGREILSEFASVLTKTRGKAAEDALKIVERGIAGREISENQASFVAGILLRPGVLGAAIAATQQLRYNPETGETE